MKLQLIGMHMPNLKRQDDQPQSADDRTIVKGKNRKVGQLKKSFAQSLWLGIGLFGISCAACFGNNAQAQITPDGSISFSLTPDTIKAAATRINGGDQQCANLFYINQIAAASIPNQSTSGLQVTEGRTLSLISGDVRLEGGKLGEVNLTAQAPTATSDNFPQTPVFSCNGS
jgi:hypothetical protein